MALNAYLQIVGAIQGSIQGSVDQPGREDQILVIAFSHGVLSPRDAASGLPTGKHRHQPLTITKEIDRSTPLLARALVNNENLPQWELMFWQPSKSGKEMQYYTIQLEDAAIIEISQEMLNNKYPDNVPHAVREHISFSYRRITWTWVDGEITANDEWQAPIA
jgi:type VI secretion system secreted protein Hcp